MAPDSMLAAKAQQHPVAYDDSMPRLNLVAVQVREKALEEPSPLMEAIRKYLDSLP
jgi:hypothetical protein